MNGILSVRGTNSEPRTSANVERKTKTMPIGWIEQPTSPLRVARSTTELNGLATITFQSVVACPVEPLQRSRLFPESIAGKARLSRRFQSTSSRVVDEALI